jgi:hypothetical protein
MENNEHQFKGSSVVFDSLLVFLECESAFGVFNGSFNRCGGFWGRRVGCSLSGLGPDLRFPMREFGSAMTI